MEDQMKRIMLKTLAVLWLFTATPLFGILPLLCLLPFNLVSKPACNLEMALLRDVISVFIADPYPGAMDAWPSITRLQLGLMSITVLAISAGALFLLFGKRDRRDKIAVS